MKKVLILILAMVLSFSVFALAACQTPCETHVDANHDGICDVCETGDLAVTHTDSNHDGKCDVCAGETKFEHTDAAHDGKCDVCGQNVDIVHVDANNDGICDVEACGHIEAWVSGLAAAKEYIDALYLNTSTLTTGNYTIVPGASVGGVFYNITWTIEIADADKAVVTLGTPGADKMVPVVVDNQVDHDVNYKLVGSIADADGHTVSVSYDRQVPKFKENTFAEYVSAEVDAPVVVKGIVVGILTKDNGDDKNGLYIVDNDGGYYIYGIETLPEGIKLGDTVRASGLKDDYNGTLEVKEATVEILDATTSVPEAKDFTDLYKAAAAENKLNKKELVYPQAQLVTIKGVTVGVNGGSDGSYYYFELDGLQSYVRISSSMCPLNAADTKAFKDGFASLFGMTADVTGVICVYSGNFYLTPVSVDAFSNAKLPELDEAGEVAFEKDALTFTDVITADSEITLQAKGAAYADVTIAWDFKAETAHDCASISDGKLFVELPENATTITLVATLTSGSVTDTKEFVVAVDAASTALYIPKFATEAVVGTYKFAVNTVAALGKVYYFDGTINDSEYANTTDKAEKAADVVIAAVDGGYTLKVGDKYLEVYKNSAGKTRVTLVDTPTSAWVFNTEIKTLTFTVDGKEYVVGTYTNKGNTFTTLSASEASYITGENVSKIDVTQFPARLSYRQFVQEGGSDVPAEHTCENACPICKGCLDSECAEEACATKCSCVEKDAPAAGTYVVEMYQSKKKINVYLTGEVSGHYLATSESSNDAMTVTLAKLENGKYTILLSNGKYLAMVASGTYINAVMQETACEFTWNAKLGNFTVAFDGTEYFFGTYGDFTTIGTCKLSYASTDYQAKLVAPLAHICDSACENCGGCLDSECTEEACTTKCSCPVAGQNGEYTLTIPAKGDKWTATTLVQDIFYATSGVKTESIKLEGAAYEADGLVFESSQISLTGGGVKVSDGLVCNAIGFAVGKGQQATVVVYGALKADKSGVTFVVKNPAMETIEVSNIKINGVDAEALDALAIDAVKKYEFTLGEGIYYFGGSGGGAYVYGMSITLADAPAGEAVTTKIDLVTNFATYASGWNSDYIERVIDISDVSTLEGTLTISRGNKQAADQAIHDRPVLATNASKSAGTIFATVELESSITSVTFDLQQWGTKTFNDIHIEYYDATTSTWVSCSSSITTPAAISSTEIPAGVTQVRLSVSSTTTKNVQLGLSAIEVTTK